MLNENSFTNNAGIILKNGAHIINQEDTGVTGKIKIDVGYRFTNNVRPYKYNGKVYGTKGMRYSELYELLCKHFNHRYFIEDYFVKYLKIHFSREMQSTKKLIEREIKRELKFIEKTTRITKKGKYDKRYTIGNKRLQDFSFWKNKMIKDHFDRIGKSIKDDIIHCLATGKIPVFHTNALSTIEKKKRIFGTPGEVFYASGKMIEDIRIMFKMEVA